jgi:ribosome-binding factor A
LVDKARARRMAVRVQQVVAQTLERQVKDPRLAMVTVTDTRVTPDLREASVFYTVYGDDAERQDSAIALQSATGVVRSAVGKALGVRFTPTIVFVADAVPETAQAIEDQLVEARRVDEQVARVRMDKQPAGEADPYRQPVERGETESDSDAESVSEPDAEVD